MSSRIRVFYWHGADLHGSGVGREVRVAEEGGFYARALGHSIFMEGDTWEELRGNVHEATAVHFDEDWHQIRLVHAGENR